MSNCSHVSSSCQALLCTTQALNPQLLHRKIGLLVLDVWMCPDSQSGLMHHLKSGLPLKAALITSLSYLVIVSGTS